MIYLRYFLLVLVSIPLLPFMYFQGKRIRQEVPSLPAAKNPDGIVGETYGHTLNLLILGESTMAGLGVQNHAEGFAGNLAKVLSTSLSKKINWQVIAESGFTARQGLMKLVPQIETSTYHLIVIGFGGNDAFKLNTPMQWQRDVGDLILAIQKKIPGAPIAFTNMPPIHDFPAFTSTIQFVLGNLVKLHGKALKKLVRKFADVYYQSDILHLKEWATKLGKPNDPKLFFSDGVHPSKLTYETWAKEFASFVLKNIEL